jgi:hypothetical protein
MNFEDAKIVINELVPLFETNKEVQLLENVNAIKKDIERACMLQNQQLQSIINQQIQQNVEAEKAAFRSEPESEHKKRMKKMETALQDLELSIQEMDNTRRNLERNTDNKQTEKQLATEERTIEENSFREDSRKTAGLLQLWQHVANGVKFDLASNGRKGYMISKKDNETRYFENPETPSVESINRMWTMLEYELDVN